MDVKTVKLDTAVRGSLGRGNNTKALIPPSKAADAASINFSDSAKRGGALGLTAKEILAGINKAIGLDPQQIESFQDRTPDTSADFVVGGLKSIFANLSEKVPEEDREEFVKTFFEDARRGIDQGYSEAIDILENLGAFQVEGVQGDVETTRLRIESKLVEFENEVYDLYQLNQEDGTSEKSKDPDL